MTPASRLRRMWTAGNGSLLDFLRRVHILRPPLLDSLPQGPAPAPRRYPRAGWPPPGQTPIVTICQACGEDISRACFVGALQLPQGGALITLVPQRCPECNAPTGYQGTIVLPRKPVS